MSKTVEKCEKDLGRSEIGLSRKGRRLHERTVGSLFWTARFQKIAGEVSIRVDASFD